MRNQVTGKRFLINALLLTAVLSVLLLMPGCGSKPDTGSQAPPQDEKETVVSAGYGKGFPGVPVVSPADKSGVPFPPDITRIRKRGKLIAAMYHGSRWPFFYLDSDGRLSGIDVDMARDIAAQLGVACEFNRTAGDFNEVVDKVARGEADIGISKLSITLARAQRVRYSEPYITFHQALMVNRLQLNAIQRGSRGTEPLELILNTADKIGVSKGTSYEEFAHRLFPKARFVSYDDQDKMMEAANKGEVLAVLYDESEIRIFREKHPDSSIYTKTIVLKDKIDPIAIAVAPGNEQLLAWLNTYLDFSIQGWSVEQRLDRYIGGIK